MSALRAALPAVLAILAGCAVQGSDGERLALGSPELRAYVERVFREQNRVATELAFALEQAQSPSAPAVAELAAAEDALLEACAGLNELATLRRDDQRSGVRRGIRSARSVPRCEAAAEAAKTALEKTSN